MVTRRLKQILVAMLAAGAVASASESGILSYRAQRSFDSGKFAKGYGQLERALLASRKEADLLSEGRVLIALTLILRIPSFRSSVKTSSTIAQESS